LSKNEKRFCAYVLQPAQSNPRREAHFVLIFRSSSPTFEEVVTACVKSAHDGYKKQKTTIRFLFGFANGSDFKQRFQNFTDLPTWRGLEECPIEDFFRRELAPFFPARDETQSAVEVAEA